MATGKQLYEAVRAARLVREGENMGPWDGCAWTSEWNEIAQNAKVCADTDPATMGRRLFDLDGASPAVWDNMSPNSRRDWIEYATILLALEDA